jgi:hypothetical protein
MMLLYDLRWIFDLRRIFIAELPVPAQPAVAVVGGRRKTPNGSSAFWPAPSTNSFVAPAKAGAHEHRRCAWIPAFAGMTRRGSDKS